MHVEGSRTTQLIKGKAMAKEALASRHHECTRGNKLVQPAWLALLLSIAVLGIAAGQQGQAAETKGTTTAADVKKESQEAMATAKEYTAQQKDAFYKKMQAELDEMQAKIDKLKEKAGKASEKTKAETEKKVQELEKQKEAAGKKLNVLKSAGAEVWGDLKSGMNKTLDDLKKSYKRALARLD